MHYPKSYKTILLVAATIICAAAIPSISTLAPPPNDNCSTSAVIAISGGGFDYGLFSSAVSDMTTATRETNEFFEFAPNHTKSVWFSFNLVTRRSTRIEVKATSGSVIPNPGDAGVTVYRSNTCLPASSSKLGAFVSSGDLSNPCLEPGNYLIQVTGTSSLNATIQVNIILGCPDHPTDSKYDCPANAYLFNGGSPLPGNTNTGDHNIGCQSIEEPSEYNCLPLGNKTEYLKSTWYVFTTGTSVDYIDFYFPMNTATDQAGYRLLEGNVRTTPYTSLPVLDCGVAKVRFNTRYIEFPCSLAPNTTYSLALLFHRDYAIDDISITARQRGVPATGWPMPVTPPVIASNQLGVLPGAVPPGILSSWTDRFDCNSFMIENVCPPANPASGVVVIGAGPASRTYDLSTWATFTLSTDANVTFRYSQYQSSADYHTRIYKRTLNAGCPSPGPADLYLEFAGNNWTEKCMTAGDYAIQVLSSADDAAPPSSVHQDAWSNGTMGTEFTLGITVVELPAGGLFRLDAPDEYNAINNLNPLQLNTTYAGLPAVFTCPSTVLPNDLPCTGVDKAIYREFNIGDADGDAIPDDGIVSIRGMRTDTGARPPIIYSIFKGDANMLATSAGTHSGGEVIPGLIDHAGFCIDEDDNTNFPAGIDSFCTCVTSGVYTVASLGNVDNVAKGDVLDFNFQIHKTIHDSRENAEVIPVGNMPGTYASQPDVFSCENNLGVMPPCGGRTKLVFREFFLAEPFVVAINEFGTSSAVLSLFSGRASDLSSGLSLEAGCFIGIRLIDDCTTLEAGWYTVVSYGEGPDYFDRPVWDPMGNPFSYMGDPRDVGKTTQVSITLYPPITPNFNRPHKAHQAGITDWATPPVNMPNATTRRIYAFPSDTFCYPDTPFIADSLLPCTPDYNRIAFYVFEITKPSFVQIRNVDPTFYTQVFPFDVEATPGALLTVPPVYPCLSSGVHFRQLCDIPPGKYTIAIFANDGHWSRSISPQIYVEEVALSRFDHAWDAYDFDVIPRNNMYVDGRPFDAHPTLPGQPPSRDVFYCTTGATAIDPMETKCNTQLNPNIYAQPFGTPKPLFLQDNPGNPRQPWRDIWYTFMLTGSGICTLNVDVLSGVGDRPFIAVYESDADAAIPWSTLQTMLNDPGNTILPGLKLLSENVDIWCNATNGNLVFTKSGCIRDSVRYYVVAGFDADASPDPPNLPNQAMSISLKYDPRPSYTAPYDERTSANVVNGLQETSPPYTSVQLAPGSSMTSVPFTLACYTPNVTDPPPCDTGTAKSAWFKFEVSASGHFYVALEEIGIPGGWYANPADMTVWKEESPGGPITEQVSLTFTNSGAHKWLEGCIDRGTYFMMIRHCADIDTIQPYQLVIELTDSPGDFCVNAIPVNVTNSTPVTGTAIVDCHTIGTDVGEFVPPGNTCFPVQNRKTSWFHAIVNAGPMVDLNFEFAENFEVTNIGLSDLAYRILAGTCGAMTPIVCSTTGTNIITLNCLGPGDYYVQVSMPERTGIPLTSPELQGTLSLTVTATPSDTQTCTDPVDPNQVSADFIYTSDCQAISLINLSTAGSDIIYEWQFPDGTSTEANPVWTPPSLTDTFQVTLVVTNIVTGQTTSITYPVLLSNAFSNHVPLPDSIICNQTGSITLNATETGATYLWDNGSTQATRVVNSAGIYWVIISKDGCVFRDTSVISDIDASVTITPTLCPEESFIIKGEVFDINRPTGLVIIPGAHTSGCDSLLTVDLSFHSPVSSALKETICTGETYMFGNQTLSIPGIYHDTLTAVNGCDSIITLELEVTPIVNLNLISDGCLGSTVTLNPVTSGNSYLWNTGSGEDTLLVSSTGNYNVSVTDANGCLVSVENFNVTFMPLPPPQVAPPMPLCIGSDVLLNATGSSGDYHWFDLPVGGNLIANGTSLFVQNVTNNMTVYVEAHMPGDQNCISERIAVPIGVVGDSVRLLSSDTILCAGSNFMLPWGEMVEPANDEVYTHLWQSVLTGCDSLAMVISIDIFPELVLSLPAEVIIQAGDSIVLMPEMNFDPVDLEWVPANGLTCITCKNPWASPEETTDYELQAWSSDGCYINAFTRVIVKRDLHIYIPNVFTPNADGVNDLFSVYGNREVKRIRSLQVYDRWGEVVWQGTDFVPNGTIGWDGVSWGKEMPSGVYVWMCELEKADGEAEVLAGDVTLVR